MSQVTPFMEPVTPNKPMQMVRPTQKKLHGTGGKSMQLIRKKRKLERQRRKANR